MYLYLYLYLYWYLYLDLYLYISSTWTKLRKGGKELSCIGIHLCLCVEASGVVKQ